MLLRAAGPNGTEKLRSERVFLSLGSEVQELNRTLNQFLMRILHVNIL
jgi:hypothetical protein